MQLEIAGLSDEGDRRRGRPNEDSLLVNQPSARLEDGALVAVADGVGGAAAGAEASAAAVHVLQNLTPGADPSDQLRAAFSEANKAVRELARSDRLKEGAGTTLVAAYLRGDQLWIANVGDSRAYRLREGRLEQLTTDHSYVQEEVDAGRITAEEARTHRRSNVITRGIGVDPSVETDVFTFDVREGDVLVLCSDGLSGPVTDAEIAWIVGTNGGRPQQAARALVRAANDGGGPDNVTAVVVRVGTRDIPRPRRRPMASAPRGIRIPGTEVRLLAPVAAIGLVTLALIAVFAIVGVTVRGSETPAAVVIPATPAAAATQPAPSSTPPSTAAAISVPLLIEDPPPTLPPGSNLASTPATNTQQPGSNESQPAAAPTPSPSPTSTAAAESTATAKPTQTRDSNVAPTPATKTQQPGSNESQPAAAPTPSPSPTSTAAAEPTATATPTQIPVECDPAVSLTTGLKVVFSSNCSGEPSTYDWQFGTDGPASTANPTHMFSSSGDYRITFKACGSDPSNCSEHNDFITITVTP